ncbi:unnamed protein product [Canis familiaris papillomavirus 10]|uniref:Regulatory protein E2 n=1 Tax=Canis familiaris papillomavirus 10 TaxID=1087109 RepID=G4XF72_9PAPI|nr:unnamed protein product [Canis familiaris papillomavirus 10]AEP82744.1 E2 [Canis familiaris papillomavirus 10]
MENLSKRLNALQDALLNLYEEGSGLLARQVEHWNLLRRENVLMHFARKSGVTRVGMQPVPPLQVTAERAKQAIEIQLVLQTLCDSPWATETWTLSDTCRERWMAPPQRCWKKGSSIVEVIYDGNPENSMQYTLWNRIYYQDLSDTWRLSKSQVDHQGIWYWDCEQKQYYVKFAPDAARFSSTGTWEVVYNNETISLCDPVTSTTPPTDVRGETALYSGRLSPNRDVSGHSEHGGADAEGTPPPSPAAEVTNPYASPLPDTTSPSPKPGAEPARRGRELPKRGRPPEPVGHTPTASPQPVPAEAAGVGVQQRPVTTATGVAGRKRARGPGAARGGKKPKEVCTSPRCPPEPPDQPQLVSVLGGDGGGGVSQPRGCRQSENVALPVADPRPLGSSPAAGGSPPPSPAAQVEEAARRPRPGPAAAREGRLGAQRGVGGRPPNLLREAGDSPQTAVVLCGPPNTLKCYRYRLQHHHAHKFLYASTTWYWTGPGSDRIGSARILLTFANSQQQTDFFRTVRLPPSVRQAPNIHSV